MSYRLDYRTKDEFKKEIKQSHIIEADIAIRIGIWHKQYGGTWPTIHPQGTDPSGEFVENESKVTHEADYCIDSIAHEITRADSKCKTYFHQKISKVNRCLNQQNNLVFVNGYKIDKQPKILIITPEQLIKVTDMAIKEYGEVGHPTKSGQIINKASYRYKLEWFDTWEMLPALTAAAKRQYKHILDLF